MTLENGIVKIAKFVEGIPGDIYRFFVKDGAKINSTLSTVQTLAIDGARVASILGEPANVAAEFTNVANGVAAAESAVSAAQNAADAQQQVAVLGNLADTLATNGSIGVKSPATQAVIEKTVNEINNAAGVIQASITASEPPAPPAYVPPPAPVSIPPVAVEPAEAPAPPAYVPPPAPVSIPPVAVEPAEAEPVVADTIMDEQANRPEPESE